jgi:hypothetical protein
MKLTFPSRNRGKKSLLQKIIAQLENYFYHRSRGMDVRQAWEFAKKTYY